MQQMHFPKIVAFVEGHMERMFLNNNFRYVSVIPVSNGITWTVEAMAKQIATLYRAKNPFADAVIVWIDREKRRETSQEIFNYIKQHLIDCGVNENIIHILVSDLMSENIILSDEPLMRLYFEDESYSYDFEGCHGKSVLKAKMKESGKTYRETVTGVELLKRVRLRNCGAVSASVRRLVDTFQLHC